MKKIVTLLFFFNLISLLFTPFVTADQSVSATVPPRTTDFQFAFTSDGQTAVPQGTILSYQITYGAQHSAGLPTTTTLVADWSSDTAPDNSEVLDYVIGSASTAYGGVTPVVDLFNHTITWTIPNLPQGVTDQSVTFQLKTTSNYTGADSVNFTIRAKMNNQYISLPDQTVSQTYQFDQSLVRTPMPTSAPTPTSPAPTGSPREISSTLSFTTPTPTPSSQTTQPSKISFTNFSFTNISQSQASLSLTTATPVKLIIKYGRRPTNLIQTITTPNFSPHQTITLRDLLPETMYYLQLTAISESGQKTTSEIFTIKTAKNSPPPVIDNNIVVVSTNGNVLLSDTQKQSIKTNPAVFLTLNSAYTIAYTLTNPIPLKSIDAVVQSKLLGANTVTGIPILPTIIIPMQEHAKNLYVADVNALNSGLYEVFIRIVDTNGNVIQKKVSNLKVMSPLTVYAQDTGLPLSDARVYFSYFDQQRKSYVPVAPDLFGNITNPKYTNSLGEIPFTLPQGKYRVEESALFYDKATADFTLGSAEGQDFPMLYLKKDPFNLISLGTFIKDYLFDTEDKIVSTLHGFALSIRIFNLFAAVTLGAFVVVTFLLFMLRSHIHIKHLPLFFLFHLDRIFKRHTGKYIFVTVANEDNEPLSQVRIEIEDADTNTILLHTLTNKSGRLYFRNNFMNSVNLILTKEGFAPLTVFLEKESEFPEEGLQLVLKKGSMHHMSFFTFVWQGFGELAGLFFEVSLVISLILEVLFFFLYGFAKTAPYFILSLLNLTLWLFYLHERHQKE